MGASIPLASLALFCNLCVLSAIAAGRARAAWIQALCLTSEVVTFGGALAASLVAFGGHGSGTAILAVIGLIGGFVLSVLLSFLEYAIAGRRSRFRADLRASLWVTPLSGITRL